MSNKYDDKYCEKHGKCRLVEKDTLYDINRCNSSTNCGTVDGNKAIIPKTDARCKYCCEKENSLVREVLFKK